MKWFSNLKIGRKLAIAFGICILLTSVMGIIAMQRISQLGSQSVEFTKELALLELLGDLDADILKFVRAEKNHILSENATEREKHQASAAKFKKESEEALGKLEEYLHTPNGEKFSAKLHELLPVYYANADKVFVLSNAEKDIEAQTQSRSGRKYLDEIDSAMEEFEVYVAGKIEKEKAIATKTISSSRATMIGLIVFVVVVALASGLMITRTISGALSQVQKAAKGLAVGDINQEITINTKDEFGDLAADFRELIDQQSQIARAAEAVASGNLAVHVQPKSTNDVLGQAFSSMLDNLRNLVSEVAKTTQNVTKSSESLSAIATQSSSASEEISLAIQQVVTGATESAETSTQIARGSEQLAIGASDASIAMEKLDNAVAQVQEGSEKQTTATARANETAMEGGKAVQATIESMDRISKQVAISEEAVRDLGEKQAQIGAIVQAIDEIAEQTNLLALNAAIEAARAGEHGRGFAVVAEEVRKLAERSSESTKEIASLISTIRAGVDRATNSMATSAEEVAEGSKFSDATKNALAEILEVIANVRELAEQNATLVASMGTNARTVSDAITNVASVSQETAAGAEEMSASAEEMAAATEEASAAVQQQTAGISEVSRMAGDLMAVSVELQELVAKFTLGDDGDNSHPLTLAA
ncbi:MAG: MCP four helix bundle domain-containing protein [Fimbriimonadaceae bacterium]|nr:MCP four helix bundle domain-containing protein [Fimbriimonadaceae bacterium]